MKTIQQPENPNIELVTSVNGETTLYIDGRQAMQAWESDLMWRSADILCTYGSRFLEVGLGLGISALRIASHPNTVQHTVIEKYQRVIDLFREGYPEVPRPLEIVCADFFEFVRTIPAGSLDGIFFDPYFGNKATGWEEQPLWDATMPAIMRSLRVGGALVPYFSTAPILKWPFIDFFHSVLVERCAYTTYSNTEYTPGPVGVAYIQCFLKTSVDA